MNSKFDTIFESNFSRFQGGGFLTGDVIKLKSDWNSCEWCKTAPEQMIDKLKELADSDLLLRVSSVQALRPSVSSNVAQNHGADDFFVDITQETAPGRFTGQFIKIPQEMIELDGPNDRLPDIPDSLKRDETVDLKPKDIKDEDISNGDEDSPDMTDPKKQTSTDDKVNRKLSGKNIKLPGATGAKSYTANYLK